MIRTQNGPDNDGPNLRMKRIGLSPRHVLDLGIPMIPGRAKKKEEKKSYKRYLKPQGLDPERIAELDAIEAYRPGGIASFVDEILSKLADESFDLEDEDRKDLFES